MEIGLVSNHSSHSNHSVVPALIMKTAHFECFHIPWLDDATSEIAGCRWSDQALATCLYWARSPMGRQHKWYEVFLPRWCVVEGHLACEKRQWNLFWSIEWISTLKPASDSFRKLLCCRNSICCSEAGTIGATAHWPLGCGYLRWGSAMD